jgi:hypothetical protein
MAVGPNTDRPSEAVEAPTDAIQAARKYGIDVSLLADNAGRTVVERIERHQIALDAARKLRKATVR